MLRCSLALECSRVVSLHNFNALVPHVIGVFACVVVSYGVPRGCIAACRMVMRCVCCICDHTDDCVSCFFLQISLQQGRLLFIMIFGSAMIC